MFSYGRWFLVGLISLLLISCSSKEQRPPVLSKDLSDSEVISRASDLNIQLGMAYLQEERLDLARLKFRRALELEPDSAKAYCSMGYYYEKAGDRDQAKVSYEQAFQLSPEDPAIQNSYGVFLCRMGEYRFGETLLLKAASHPHFEQVGLAYQNAAFCFAKEGDSDQAIVYFKKAIAHNPRLVASYFELANTYFSVQNYKESDYYFKQFNARANPTPQSLELGIKLADHFSREGEMAGVKAKRNATTKELE